MCCISCFYGVGGALWFALCCAAGYILPLLSCLESVRRVLLFFTGLYGRTGWGSHVVRSQEGCCVLHGARGSVLFPCGAWALSAARIPRSAGICFNGGSGLLRVVRSAVMFCLRQPDRVRFSSGWAVCSATHRVTPDSTCAGVIIAVRGSGPPTGLVARPGLVARVGASGRWPGVGVRPACRTAVRRMRGCCRTAAGWGCRLIARRLSDHRKAIVIGLPGRRYRLKQSSARIDFPAGG